MSILITHVVLSVLFAVMGLGTGWWLHRQVELSTPSGDSGLARELLASLHCLARRVSADVSEHHESVDQVDRQLASLGPNGSADVRQLVAELLKANSSIQKKLTATEQKLEKLTTQIEVNASEARTDALTTLPNRRAFEEEAARRMVAYAESNEAFSVLMVDIDRFKTFNDRYGHACGDEVLRGVGQVLSENVRGRDLVARYGGEEFTVLMPTLPMAEARRVAETLREAVEHTRFQVNGQSLTVTVSVGVAEIFAYEDFQGLLKRADQALYAAKHAGRNNAFWHDGTLSHPARSHHSEQTRSPAPTQAGSAPQPARRASDATPGTLAASPPSRNPQAVPTHFVTPTDIDLELLRNIANKTMFCQDIRRHVAEWNRSGRPFSVLLIRVNDYDALLRKYGDSVGKLVLTMVAQSLGTGLRSVDVLAQFSVDTIGLILTNTDLDNARRVGQRLCTLLGQTAVLLDGDELTFDVTLGAVQIEDGDEMATLVERAQAELEREAGRRTSATSHPLSV